MDTNINIDGGDELARETHRMAIKVPSSLYGMVRDSCLMVETRAKTHHLAGATLDYQTHRLQHSVKTQMSMSPFGGGPTVSGRVGSPIAYAAIHEFGGIIKPVNAKFLVFRIDGETIFAKQVKIPKREWLSKSLADVHPMIDQIFGKHIKLLVEGA